MIRGRLVIPALNSLAAASLWPFPHVSLIAGRCHDCPAIGMGWAVALGYRGGFSARHERYCAFQ